MGKAEQSSRLKIDENGMTAASFAEVSVVYGGLPPVTLNIVLNRPFFVLVTDYGSIPLFAAVVNEP